MARGPDISPDPQHLESTLLSPVGGSYWTRPGQDPKPPRWPMGSRQHLLPPPHSRTPPSLGQPGLSCPPVPLSLCLCSGLHPAGPALQAAPVSAARCPEANLIPSFRSTPPPAILGSKVRLLTSLLPERPPPTFLDCPLNSVQTHLVGSGQVARPGRPDVTAQRHRPLMKYLHRQNGRAHPQGRPGGWASRWGGGQGTLQRADREAGQRLVGRAF